MQERTFTGTRTKTVAAYEGPHRTLAKQAAAEGFVLLKNENHVLPLRQDKKIALYGAGAVETVKGGTGSGDVNERETISIQAGLAAAGIVLTTGSWLGNYADTYQRAREAWRDEILVRAEEPDSPGFFDVYSTTPFHLPVGEMPVPTDTDTAIYVHSRIAGEGADRVAEKGDYYLLDAEEALLGEICRLYPHVIVLINTGGVIDCSFLDTYSNVEGVLYISQPGMEAGNAVADVLLGRSTPCGKLTDSWAFAYEDYPNARTFSHQNGNVEKEWYTEGIFVGYRYFDTFQVPVRFGFGCGLSYTSFSMTDVAIRKQGSHFFVTVCVKNIGDTYAGREVVQVYAACPGGRLCKEYRRLAGFAKTGLLAPGASEKVTISFTAETLTSYDEAAASWLLEPGCYGIYVGNSLAAARLAGSVAVEEEITVSRVKNICPMEDAVRKKWQELSPEADILSARRIAMEQEADGLPVLSLEKADVQTECIDYGRADRQAHTEAMAFVKTLGTEELIRLATGNPAKGQGSHLGSAGITVPGSAAETSDCAADRGLASIVLADGPAGLRLNQSYQVKDGVIVPKPFQASLEHGFFDMEESICEGETYYQYCTAIPVGTLLAQTWDAALVRQIGEVVAEEMHLFGVTLWLAPGMNIHRNPLCGRNFEYYAEDPLLSGVIAAAMTRGVQSVPGCGTTIKHFCCNNQEDNRMDSDSILSERTLREIYLKGFEIAVKTSAPMSIMTSYNKINGIHAANHYDLCTTVARKEWDFDGTIMTDWTTTEQGEDCTAAGCVRAGNDLVMPGQPEDHESIRKALESKELSLEELQLSVARTVNVIYRTKKIM